MDQADHMTLVIAIAVCKAIRKLLNKIQFSITNRLEKKSQEGLPVTENRLKLFVVE